MIDIKKKDRKNGWIDFRKSIVKKSHRAKHNRLDVQKKEVLDERMKGRMNE